MHMSWAQTIAPWHDFYGLAGTVVVLLLLIDDLLPALVMSYPDRITTSLALIAVGWLALQDVGALLLVILIGSSVVLGRGALTSTRRARAVMRRIW